MSLALDLVDVIVDLLDDPDFATSVTVKRAPSTFDVVAGTVGAAGAIEQHSVVQGSMLNHLVSDIRMVGNSSTMITDILLLFRGSAHILDADKVTFQGDEYNVLSTAPIAVGGVSILQKVVLRR